MKSKKSTFDIEEVTKELEQGVLDVYSSGRYAEYLRFVSQFYDYSANNCLLIWMQMPTASLVAGFKAWQTKFNRTVKKGEKGIRILAPIPKKFTKIEKDKDGNEVEKVIQYTAFHAAYVFDLSQTEGEDVPRFIFDLDGDVERFAEIVEKLKALAPCPVIFEKFDSPAKGYYDHSENKIVVQPDMSEAQKLKTLIHEISHALLHGKDCEQADADRRTKEVQAESVAFTVCAAFGIDTSDYSFGYVASWSEGREVKELTASMDVIRQTAKEMIEKLKAA